MEDFAHDLKNFLKSELRPFTSDNPYHYALFPSGKLIRPKLLLKIGQHLDIPKESLTALAMAVELHHTYSLVHDDLPAMDDDDLRRGRPSTHKKFSEWQAILCGDGLLGLSYKALLNLPSEILPPVLKLFSWCTGTKGLVLGQEMDLSGDLNFRQYLRMIELKTARLFIFCTTAPVLLSPQKNLFRHYFRLGHAFGITFQLQDDLSDLEQDKEQENPNGFLLNAKLAQIQLDQQTLQVERILEKEKISSFP